MTIEEALNRSQKILGKGFRVRFFQGRTRTWWGCATALGVRDQDGNEYDWAERLGFLTPVTVDTFSRDALRELGAIPKNEPPAAA